MIEYLHILALALLQGITEFLPISSSAHLILLPKIMGWEDQGLSFDIAFHVGSLLAVVCYFRRELSLMAKDWFYSLLGKPQTLHSRLAWAIGLTTIPVGLSGLFAKHLVEIALRSQLVIATTTILFGLVLGYAAWRATCKRDEHKIGWRDIVWIGCAQALALIPGTSRSGITMTAGLFVGLTKEAAARFSFYLAIPVIALAGGLEAATIVRNDITIHWQPLLFGTAISAISAFCCIHLFLKLLARIGLLPFVLYRLALGLFILTYFN